MPRFETQQSQQRPQQHPFQKQHQQVLYNNQINWVKPVVFLNENQ